MGCKITSEIIRGCRGNTGGIKRVLIANFEDVLSVTPVISDDNTDTGFITDITMNGGTPVPGFYRYEFNKDSSAFTQAFAQDLPSGTGGWTQTINLVFAKNEASKRNSIKMLGQNNTAIIVEDRNGKYWYFGEESGMELMSVDSGSGVLMSDRNGYAITFEGRERFGAREIFDTDKATTDALVDSLLAI